MVARSQPSLLSAGERVKLLLPIPSINGTGFFDYIIPSCDDYAYHIGDMVTVSFGHRRLAAIIWEKAQDHDDGLAGKLKEIDAKSDDVAACPSLSKAHMDFITWVSEYTLSPLGMVAKMTMGQKDLFKPTHFKRLIKFEAPQHYPDHQTLSHRQAEIAQSLEKLYKNQKFFVGLLDGVTGSGKTAIYLQMMAKILRMGQQVLILLPEIALSAQFVQRIHDAFGVVPALWHSSLTPSIRKQSWFSIAKGEAKIIIGARSALFLPYRQLGMIVVDEEHDASYKQSEGICYHARDMAIMRAKLQHCPVVLASATPSLETLVNVVQHKYHQFKLEQRYGKAAMPEIELVDLRGKRLDSGHFISPTLVQSLQENLQARAQSLLFLNRRGFAPLLLCRQCGYHFACPNCTAWLVTHQINHENMPSYLQCHHCGFRQSFPKHCPECEEENSFAACGPGVERLEMEVKQLFPQANIAIASAETLDKMAKAKAFIDAVMQGEIDIIIGTQIIAKGYHFPNLTLVGVIDADLGLQGGDLRAGERCYQLLQQVAGRAGREEKPGHVLLQTRQPQSLLMQALQSQNRDDFMQMEIDSRREFGWPPFVKIALINLMGRDEQQLDDYAKLMARHAPYNDKVMLLGPATPYLAKIRNQ